MADNDNTETPLNERVGTWVPDLDDRRRVAEQSLIMTAYANETGNVHPAQWGEIVLQHVTSEDEVIPLNDALNLSISKRIARGML